MAIIGTTAVILAIPGAIAAMPDASRIVRNILDGPPWTQLDPKVCPNYLSESHEIFNRRQPEPPNSALVKEGISIVPSERFAGRAKVTFGWLNPVPVAQAGVAITGVYGEKLATDQNVVGVQSDAKPGDCYHWYVRRPANPDQADAVKIAVDGLWPHQKYCFYAMYQTRQTESYETYIDDTDRLTAGWSKPTEINCFTVSWNNDWGTPAYPPE